MNHANVPGWQCKSAGEIKGEETTGHVSNSTSPEARRRSDRNESRTLSIIHPSIHPSVIILTPGSFGLEVEWILRFLLSCGERAGCVQAVGDSVGVCGNVDGKIQNHSVEELS